MKNYNCLIVDDHFSSQEILKKYIGSLSSLKILAVCNNAIDAISEIQNKKVDLLFLDIEMPQLSGFDFLKTLKTIPPIILTTAHTMYAKEAFDFGVIDFLHKPYPFDRFLKAINRVAEIESEKVELDNCEHNYIFLKSGIQLIKLFLEEIIYVEAYGNYTKFHLSNNKIELITDSLFNIEHKLSKALFIRIHKSYLISLKFISAIKNKNVLVENIELPLGDSYKKTLLDFYGK